MLCRNLGFLFLFYWVVCKWRVVSDSVVFFPLAMYSQKAILKIKNPNIKCVFETFNSQNSTKI
jgi:hypothetical protein